MFRGRRHHSHGFPVDVVAPPSYGPKATFDVQLKDSEAIAQDDSGEDALAELPTSALTSEQLETLFARADDLPEATDLSSDFFKREETLKAPKTGKRVDVPFPPPTEERPQQSIDPEQLKASAKEKAGPVTVLRATPKGDQGNAVPSCTLTFNQPMVALSSVDNVNDQSAVELKLTPDVKGCWRWHGPTTIKFEPEHRFPFSTDYVVTAPKGMTSILGNKLAEDFTLSFSTNTPRLVAQLPVGVVQTLSPVFFMGFDQRVNPDDLLSRVKIVLNGRDTFQTTLSLVDQEEAAKMDDLKWRIRNQKAGKETWFAFTCADPLPNDTKVQVEVGPEVPSAEGPKTSKKIAYNFETYPPFDLNEFSPRTEFRPGDSWHLVFTNPPNISEINKDMFAITPKLDDFDLTVHEGSVSVALNNSSRPNTIYKIEVTNLKDIHGQSIRKNKCKANVKEGYKFGQISGPSGLVTLDPCVDPFYHSILYNLEEVRVTVWQVDPEKYNTGPFGANRPRGGRGRGGAAADTRKLLDGFGKSVYDEKMTFQGVEDVPDVLMLDLLPHLSHGRHGHVVVMVDPTEKCKNIHGDFMHRSYACAWIQVTNVGLTVLSPNGREAQAIGWVTDLSTGKSHEGAIVKLLDSQNESHAVALPPTSKDGLTPATTLEGATRRNWLGVVTLPNKDSVLFPNIRVQSVNHDGLRMFVFDDRNLYKPKETVSVKGYIRDVTAGPLGEILPQVPKKGGNLKYRVSDCRGAEIVPFTNVEVSEQGSFFFSFPLPDNMNLGNANVQLQYEGIALENPKARRNQLHHNHSFKVQEFRTPEFSLSCTHRPNDRLVTSEHRVGKAFATANAQYFSGGSLSGADVRWSVNAAPATYSPPGWMGYNFGEQISHFGRHFGGGAPEELGNWNLQSPIATDANGEHELEISFTGGRVKPGPINLTARAVITDKNMQAQEVSTSFLLHQSSLCVGHKLSKRWGKVDEPFLLSVVVCDLDGNAVEGKSVAIEITKKYMEKVTNERGISKLEEVTAKETLSVTSSLGEAVDVAYTPDEGGNYTFEFTVIDDQQDTSVSTSSMYVMGGISKQQAPSARVSQENVTIVANQEKYAPGEEAELLIQTPFSTGEGMMMVLCGGVVHQERFELAGESTSLKVKIEEAWLPNVMIDVHVLGNALRVNNLGLEDPTQPPRPAFAAGSQQLNISLDTKKFQAQISSRLDAYKPGEEATLSVTVLDESGEGVKNVEVAIVAVDEAVLSLTDHEISESTLLSTFYQSRSNYCGRYESRNQVLLLSSEQLEQLKEQCRSRLKADSEPQVEMMMECASYAAPMAMMAKSAAPMAMMARAAPRKSVAKRTKAKSMARRGAAPEPAMNMMAMDSMMMDEDADGWGGALDLEGDGSSISVRTNFNPLAVFQPSASTDESGEASVTFKLPDSVTKYRIWAVAATNNMFGVGEASIKAQLPLILRPSPPRFLNFGDRCEVAVVLQNQTKGNVNVGIALRGSNIKQPDGDRRGYQVAMKADQRGVVRFPVETDNMGKAVLQFVTAGNNFADAVQVELPVYTPATSEAFSAVGDVGDDGATMHSIITPADAFPQFGGLEVSTSSTALQALTDAAIYLIEYPFNCTEQLSSRLLGILSLRDILEAFNVADIPTPTELDSIIQNDFEELKRRQEPSGGFRWWPGCSTTISPFLSIHVASAVALALSKSYPQPDQALVSRCKLFCNNIENFLKGYPWLNMSVKTKTSLVSYAMSILKKFGEDTADKADKYFKKHSMSDFTLESLAWLLQALAPANEKKRSKGKSVFDGQSSAPSKTGAKILGHLMNHTSEETETASFVTDYGDDGQLVLLHSNRRTDGVCLGTLLTVAPDSDLIVKVAKGLLAHRKKGKWRSTQENCHILMALDLYFRVREAETPDFVVQMWLGSQWAGKQEFKGRSTDTNVLPIPMAALAEQDKTNYDLVFDKQGPGRLYYRLTLKYAPTSLKLKPANYGFEVTRWYEGIDNKSDAVMEADGSWHLRLGSKIRVCVKFTTTTRRYHMALVDNLPGGLEILNPLLKGTVSADLNGDDQAAQPRPWGCWRYIHPSKWFEHQNLRDERAEAFRSLLWEGTYEYRYAARATSLGTFVAPPAKAEEMYSPENFGRTATDRVLVTVAGSSTEPGKHSYETGRHGLRRQLSWI